MAAADWSQVQERKVFVSMRKQRRIPTSGTEREGTKNARARVPSPPPPSMTLSPQTGTARADFNIKIANVAECFVQ
jgi:hypothetical protein